MNLKRNSLIVLIVGFVSLLIGAITPIVCLENFKSKSGVGIIGGASSNTYKFLLASLFDGFLMFLVLLGIALIISAVFCLLFSNTVKTHCNIKTSLISLGLSSIGALGVFCAVLWFTFVSFHETSKFPIAYPVSVMIGVVCLFVFFLLIMFYIKSRKNIWSVKGFVIDILTSIIYFPAFFLIFQCFYR